MIERIETDTGTMYLNMIPILTGQVRVDMYCFHCKKAIEAGEEYDRHENLCGKCLTELNKRRK